MSRRLENNNLGNFIYKTNYCANLPKKVAQSILYVLRFFFWLIYARICHIYYIGNFLYVLRCVFGLI